MKIRKVAIGLVCCCQGTRGSTLVAEVMHTCKLM